jgi:hypothetical protein
LGITNIGEDDAPMMHDHGEDDGGEESEEEGEEGEEDETE